jgi:flagellar basal-body rod protein FlgF
LAVQDGQGNEVYTRRGDIKVSENGVLTTGSGNVVLGDDGPITLPPTTRAQVSPDGTISILAPGSVNNEMTPVARLKLVNPGENLIQIRSDGLYQTETKELLPVDAEMKVTAGGLEGSAANPIESMINMIRDSRAYEMNVRVIKNAKEVSTASASMMRLDG